MGRPRMDEEDRKSCEIKVRFTKKERENIKLAAQKTGMTTAEFIRNSAYYYASNFALKQW